MSDWDKNIWKLLLQPPKKGDLDNIYDYWISSQDGTTWTKSHFNHEYPANPKFGKKKVMEYQCEVCSDLFGAVTPKEASCDHCDMFLCDSCLSECCQ